MKPTTSQPIIARFFSKKYCLTIAAVLTLSIAHFGSLSAQIFDLCEEARVLEFTGGDGIAYVTGNNNSSTSTGAPPDCGNGVDNDNGGGQWYTFTGTGSRYYEVTTCDANTIFDTEISLFTGECGNLTCVDGNDDASNCTNGPGTSASSIITQSGADPTDYYIYVKGNNGATGTFGLGVIPLTAPENDLCINAMELVLNPSTRRAIISDELNHSTMTDAPTDCGADVNNADSGGIWYSFTGSGGSFYEITTCYSGTSFDTEISVYSGDCGNLTCIDGSDNDGVCTVGAGTSLSTVTLSANVVDTEYYIYLKGKDGARGNFQLSVENKTVENDLCADAIPLATPVLGGEDVVFSGSTSMASAIDAPAPCNEVTNMEAPGIWYTFMGEANRRYRLNSCRAANAGIGGFEVTVYSGDCNDLTCVGGENNNLTCGGRFERVNFGSSTDTQFFIYVKAEEGVTEFFEFSLFDRGEVLPENLCDGAQAFTVPLLGEIGLDVSFNDVIGIDAPVNCIASTGTITTGGNINGGLWFKFDVLAGRRYEINTCFDNPSRVGRSQATLYTGTCGDLTCVEDDIEANLEGVWPCENRAILSVIPSADTEYYLYVVGRFLSTSLPFRLTVTDLGVAEPISNSCNAAEDIVVPVNGMASVNGSTIPAYNKTPILTCDGDNPKGLWYSFEARANSLYEITTCDPGTDVTNIDPILSLFTGSCDALVCENSNNEDFNCAFNRDNATIRFFAPPIATRYYIYLAGEGLSSGDFTMNITDFGEAPPNDICLTAEEITLPPGGSVSTFGTTTDATNLVAPNFCMPEVDNTLGGGVWYRIRPDEDVERLRVYEVTTCSPNTTANMEVSIFRGRDNCEIFSRCHGDYGSNFGCINGGAYSTAYIIGGSSDDLFFIYVKGEAGAEGDFELTITDMGDYVRNIECFGADEIPIPMAGTGTSSGSTLSAVGFDLPDCNAEVNNDDTGGLWFSFTGTGGTLYEISTCDVDTEIDTEITLFTGDCNSLECIDGNDDDGRCADGTASSLEVAPDVNTEYLVFVKGNAGTRGTFNINITDLGAAAPAELISFSGEPEGKVNKLVWETATEIGTAWHIVERSVDGRSWQEIGRVPAAGQSSVAIQYAFEDQVPLLRTYYRLNTLDFDGSEGKSPTILIERDDIASGLDILNVSPVPARDIMNVAFYTSTQESVELAVFDLHGRLLQVQKIDPLLGENQVQLNMQDLPQGAYVLSLLGSDHQVSKRVVKMK